MTKINSGTIVIAFFAILAGMVGIYAYRQATKPLPVAAAPVEAKPRPPASMVVPMVSRNLTAGQQISMDDVALVRLTKSQLDEMGLNKAFMTKPEQIIGKRVKNGLKRGSTFDTRDFYPTGQAPGIAHRLKPGQRAVTVSLSPTNALLGFAGAGQRVDVLFHYGEAADLATGGAATGPASGSANPAEQTGSLRSATSTLVQGAEILALNQMTGPTTEASGVPMEQRTLVTLAVFPREAEILRVAGGHGELSLTLRNPTDELAVPLVDPRTLDEIINVTGGVREMEIYRGKEVSRLRFANAGGIKRRLIDGSRDDSTAAKTALTRIQAAVQAATKSDVKAREKKHLSAGHDLRGSEIIGLAPAIDSSQGQSILKLEPTQNMLDLTAPASSRGWSR